MKKYIEVLITCPIFNKLSEGEIDNVLHSIKTVKSTFDRGQTIAIEGEDCKNIGIVLQGSLEIQKIYASGKVVTVDTLGTGSIFGEVIVFSDMHRYPSSIISSVDTSILYISKEEVIRLCSSDSRIMDSFMGLLSNKILMLNRKIKNLSYQTIRQKIASLLLEENAKKRSLRFVLPFSRKVMAEQMGVPRPSLSRELIRMQEEGILDFDRNIFIIKDLSLLEECLMV